MNYAILKSNYRKEIFLSRKEASDSFFVNCVLAVECSDYLFKNMGLRVDCIVKSPYSRSLYINLLTLDDKYHYSIRISNHYCNELSNDNIYEIITDNGDFILNKLAIKAIHNNILKVNENEYFYEIILEKALGKKIKEISECFNFVMSEIPKSQLIYCAKELVRNIMKDILDVSKVLGRDYDYINSKQQEIREYVEYNYNLTK